MQRIAKVFSLLSLLIACLTIVTFAQSPTPNATAYGAYPANYQEIVTAWLEKELVDPKSAIIKWLGEPKPAELAGDNGEKITGYLVEFSVNARNRFGAYTGAQKHGALIRDGKVLRATGGYGYH